MTTLTAPNFGFNFLGSRGASEVAKRTEQAARVVVDDVKFGSAWALSPLVNELFSLAQEENVGFRVVAKAIQFASMLPLDVLAPELSIDPDGEVAFDWASSEGMISVSVGAKGRLTYAAEIGDAAISGTVRMDNVIPSQLAVSLNSFRPKHSPARS